MMLAFYLRISFTLKVFLIVIVLILKINSTHAFDSLQVALQFHQASKFDKALPIFISLSEKYKAKNDLSNYALCQVKIADIVRNYGGATIALQLLEASQRFIEVKLEIPSLVLSQNFIAKAEAFYANSDLKEFKTAILNSIKVKKELKLPSKYFVEDYLHLARYYLEVPDRSDSCIHWASKALKLAKSDKQFSLYLLPRIYNLIGYYFHPKSFAYFRGKEDSAKGLFIISRKYYDSSLSVVRRQPLKDELMTAKIYHNLGNSFNNEGQNSKALKYYRSSLAKIEKFGSPNDLANEDWVIARAFQWSNQNDSAIVQLQKGIVRLIPNFKPSSIDDLPALQPTLNDQWFSSLLILKADNYFNRYQQTKNINDLLNAFNHYLHSVKFNKYLVSKSANETETINWAYLFGTNAYQRVVDVGFLLLKQTGNKNHLQNAYPLIASSKYSFLAKGIIDPKTYRSINLSQLEDENKIVTANILKSIPQITKPKLVSILPRIEKSNANTFSSTKFAEQFLDSVTLTDIKTELARGNSALVDYYLAGDKLYSLTLTGNDFDIRSKNISKDFITSIKWLNKNLLRIHPHEFAQQSHKVYEEILDSVLMRLPQNITRLIICPDNILQEIAWESLAIDTTTSKQFRTINYLVRKYSIRTVLKPNQMISRNLKMSEGFFGVTSEFANSKRFTSIPFSTNLVSLKAKEFNGMLSTSLSNDSVNINILHIASHVVTDSIHPYNSKIYFENDSLSVNEISKLNLKLNLVILNGCQTGKGKYVQSEGSLSIARAFCLIGANSLITTLWSVDDKASADILKTFYDNIEDGKELDIALQSAKLNFIAQTNSDELANPFYWSGLQLTGSANPVLNTNYSKHFLYGSIATLLLGIGFWRFRKRRLAFRTVHE
jgi:CHAT domain-containing protein